MKPSGHFFRGMKRFMAAALVVLAVPALAAAAMTVKMSYNGPPSLEDNAVHAFATTFKELVEKESGGGIVIDLYPNSQLGNEQQRMEQVMTGPMINVASFGGMETVFPEMFATNVPFMFESYAAAHEFFDNSSFMDKAGKELRSRTGIELLAVVEEGGFIAFTSKKPVRSPADFKGMKFRAMDASQVAMYEAFGASGTPIPWTEVYLALKTGVADGQMNPPTYIIIGSLYEVQDHLTLANVQYSDQFLLINGELLDSLPDSQRQVIRKAAHEANVKTRQFVESQVDERVKFLAGKGMTVYTPTAEELAQFKELGSPSYIKWLSGQIDTAWIDHAMEDARKANEAVK
ncbi:TRAP transporter substrate-binding protein DctP [Oleidesulfovibrio alaskensis]|jgi:tripartite ATP-independent transporter DctP family solute receptor|uniref:TRAP transporter substrate-binding protein n=1 Tax=Oleidesulfovibrio alaskensis TaxID=58180 RepID=UPI0004089001|nr:TRAP transporter substrate-binding protein DctP [Oleidesulfovibrio alaskensis]MBG0773396.1 TRAP transporter substrate-binding protein DctP [Oleidesulfovibrio alaskensis]MBL3582357.1 TRAP transporter substrate-binding protein DctP [Oleidesulfovibrio alaskensis]